MSETQSVSVRLEPGLDDQVTAIAAAMDKPKDWVIEQAIKDFVALQAWQIAAIDAGIEAAAEGRVVEHDDVVAWVRSWDHPDELPPPKCA